MLKYLLRDDYPAMNYKNLNYEIETLITHLLLAPAV